jgi:hypothetical protein
LGFANSRPRTQIKNPEPKNPEPRTRTVELEELWNFGNPLYDQKSVCAVRTPVLSVTRDVASLIRIPREVAVRAGKYVDG